MKIRMRLTFGRKSFSTKGQYGYKYSVVNARADDAEFTTPHASMQILGDEISFEM